MSKFENHECPLGEQEEEVLKQFIDSGAFIFTRRKIRSWCMLSRSHPETAKYFKSNAACRHEEIRHLLHHYHIVHPFSKLSLYWEFYMFLVYTAQFIMIPVCASVPTTNFSTYYMAKLSLDTLQIIDIVKLFCTGYYHNEKNKVIMNCGSVAKRYLLTYFVVDFLPTIHIYVYVVTLILHTEIGIKAAMVLRSLNRLKIFRIPRWLLMLELFRQYMGYSSYLFKGIKVILVFLVVTFWAFSIHFLAKNFVGIYVDKEDLHLTSSEIFEMYYEATLLLLLVSYEKYEIDNLVEHISAIFFLCFGYAMQMCVYVQILQVWSKYASSEDKQQSLEKQFKEYVKYKELPVSLRQRFFSYFQFKFHKYFFKESDLNNMVSPILKQEILLHVTRNHIEKVEFFRYLPENILMKIVGHLKTEIFLPGDVIISAGSAGTSMFFIYHGTVAVYTPSGKEICHLEDGAHFGEIALILSETRVATVVAVTASELFTLRRSDFLAAIEPYPEFRDRLIAVATVRLHKTILRSEDSV